jgi:hypothetical protein
VRRTVNTDHEQNDQDPPEPELQDDDIEVVEDLGKAKNDLKMPERRYCR